MLTTKQKIHYFLNSFLKTIARRGLECPSCGNAGSEVVDRKYLVTRLLRCDGCHLLYRAPTTTDKEFRVYYQEDYSEGFTTDLPSVERLKEMKASKFAGTEKNYSKYIEVLRALGCSDGAALLDFGCSWGYGSWQFSEAGFAVKAFELSKNRGAFASRHMDIEVYSNTEEITGMYDVFFSAHVLEHIPKLSGIIDLARKVVRPGGWFVAFTPNGSEQYRNLRPQWKKSWGFVHPLVLDEVFYQAAFSKNKYFIGSSPFNISEITTWSGDNCKSKTSTLAGDELMIAVKL